LSSFISFQEVLKDAALPWNVITISDNGKGIPVRRLEQLCFDMLRNALSGDCHRIVKTIKTLYWEYSEREIVFRVCSYLFVRMQKCD